MANPRYYPPGLPRTDPLVRLYDLFYQQEKDLADLRVKLDVKTKSSDSKVVVPSGALSDQVVVTALTLSAASTTIDIPRSGALWIVVLRQDVTGGRAIVWGAGVTAISPTIDTTASSISTFFLAFDRSTNLWAMVGQLSTGMAP